MHCSQKCSQARPIAWRYCTVTARRRGVAPDGARARAEGRGRAGHRRAAHALTLFTIKQLNAKSDALSENLRTGDAASLALTVNDGPGQLNAARSARRKTNLPGEVGTGTRRGRDGGSRTEARHSAMHGVTLGSCRARFALNHEITVSSVPVGEPSQLLTVPQAAQRLGVCRRTLERLVSRGEFPRPLRVGGAVRVPLSDVQAFVASLVAQRGAA